jgi:hypothetical protein
MMYPPFASLLDDLFTGDASMIRKGNSFNALIRTHHVTSRKKVARVKKAAHKKLDYLLIRSGGSPGLMYAEGDEEEVINWVSFVQGLRYKDYQCIRKPSIIQSETSPAPPHSSSLDVEEGDSVATFASKMAERGLLPWWRRAMGYAD